MLFISGESSNISNQPATETLIYMYMYMYTMAKTIMIANKVYEDLKQMKEDQSFSDAIRALMERKNSKTGGNLRACLGRLERTDTEYERSRKVLRKEYAKWNKRYA